MLMSRPAHLKRGFGGIRDCRYIPLNNLVNNEAGIQQAK